MDELKRLLDNAREAAGNVRGFNKDAKAAWKVVLAEDLAKVRAFLAAVKPVAEGTVPRDGVMRNPVPSPGTLTRGDSQ